MSLRRLTLWAYLLPVLCLMFATAACPGDAPGADVGGLADGARVGR